MPFDDIPLVSNHKWPAGDHRLVLADFLVEEAHRLLARAEALVASTETASGASESHVEPPKASN